MYMYVICYKRITYKYIHFSYSRRSTKRNDHKVLFKPGQQDDPPSKEANVNIIMGNEGESGIPIQNEVNGDVKKGSEIIYVIMFLK